MRIDLVVTSERLADKNTEELYAAIPAGNQVFLLGGVPFPIQLLAAVAEKLALPGTAIVIRA
jgi:hypothetical protein